MLASRYSSIDGSREYQIILDLYRLKQESYQTITDFFWSHAVLMGLIGSF
jgi:hypothetical protein